MLMIELVNNRLQEKDTYKGTNALMKLESYFLILLKIEYLH